MIRSLAAAVLLAAAAISAPGITPVAFAQAAQVDVFDQRSFPCEEDEVLGYAPQFGPDRVGCIHIEDLVR